MPKVIHILNSNQVSSFFVCVISFLYQNMASVTSNRNTRDKHEPNELERLKKNSHDQLNRLVQEVN